MAFIHTFTCSLEHLIWLEGNSFASPEMSHPADGKEAQRDPMHLHKVKLQINFNVTIQQIWGVFRSTCHLAMVLKNDGPELKLMQTYDIR